MKTLVRTSIILLIVFAAFFTAMMINGKFGAPEDGLKTIYSNNIKPCMNYWTTDPNFTDTNGMQSIAMRLYDKGEFGLSLEAFQRFEPAKEDEPLYNLYIGICYLKNDFDNLAINHLLEAVDLSTKYEQKQLSRWYLSLAYLKAGIEKEAIHNLEQIVEVNAPQKSQAKAILSEINYSGNPIRGLMTVFAD